MYIPLIIIPLFILGYISNSIFSNSIIEKTVKNVADNSMLIVTRINTIISNAGNGANITTLNLIDLIKDNQNYLQNNILLLEMRWKIENELSLIKVTFPDVESAFYVDTEFNIFSSSNRLFSNKDKVRDSEIYKRVDQSNPENIFFPMQQRDYLVLDENVPVLTIAKKVIDPSNGKKLGMLVLNIKESTISEVYKSVGPESITSYFILNEQGIIVSSQNKQDLLQPYTHPDLGQLIFNRDDFSERKKIDREEQLISSTSMEYLGWKLVSVIPIKELTADIDKNTFVVIILGLLCMSLAIIAASALSTFITNPLVKLLRKMDEVKRGNLNIVLNINSRDEIGRLAYQFNEMIKRIRELIHNSEAEQKKLREYELALIQAQIKPHFLYNSLELAYTLSGMAGAKDAQIAIKSLADYYRVVLSKGKEIITIEEELKSVNDYLNIQRYRYYDVFDFEISVQEEIKVCKILKLTLQPLVENSIYHALKLKGGFGKITINGTIEDEKVLLKVIDDGVGISQVRLAEILDYKRSTAEGQSFGLRSVDERIKLFFGEEYGLEVKSKPGEGTTITVVIPVRLGR